MTEITPDTLLNTLSHHQGEANGISVRDLAIEITGRSSEGQYRQIRNIVKALRTKGHHICSHPQTGYFIAETPEELNRTCRHLVDRAMASLQQVAAMRRESLPDLYKQLRITE